MTPLIPPPPTLAYNTNMITVTPLTAENIDSIAGLYNAFRGTDAEPGEAQTKYYWDHQPVEFSTLKKGIAHKLINGYAVLDSSEPSPLGFMLYIREEHRAIEINLVYIQEGREQKTIVDRLMRRFIADIKELPGWDVVSFAMLGPQAEPIVKFNIMDPVSLHILKTQDIPLPEGYTLDYWKPEYAGEVAKSVYEAFSGATDALWDPRFKTELGAKKVVGLLTSGQQGPHIPQCTSIMLHEGIPIGFCFMVQATMTQGNIPLIGMRKGHNKKKLGHLLLRHALDACVDNILAGKIGMLEISATHDTDNFAAIRMYRHLGFRDYYNYPHVYLTAEKTQQMVVGKWC